MVNIVGGGEFEGFCLFLPGLPSSILLFLFLVFPPFLPSLPLCVFGLQLAGHVEQQVLVVDNL